jgi:hypothetical protein
MGGKVMFNNRAKSMNALNRQASHHLPAQFKPKGKVLLPTKPDKRRGKGEESSMKEKNQMAGSFCISWGKYGGWYFRSGHTTRLCLGWLAFTYFPFEIDEVLTD